MIILCIPGEQFISDHFKLLLKKAVIVLNLELSMTELSDQTGLDQPFAILVDAVCEVDNHYLIHQNPSKSVCVNWLLPASFIVYYLLCLEKITPCGIHHPHILRLTDLPFLEASFVTTCTLEPLFHYITCQAKIIEICLSRANQSSKFGGACSSYVTKLWTHIPPLTFQTRTCNWSFQLSDKFQMWMSQISA